MSAHDRTPGPDQRQRYRGLFSTYPRAWRSRHEDVVLDTLLDVHAARGAVRPSLTERIRFAVDGLRVRVVDARRTAPTRRFASPEALTPLRAFDQSNGLVEDARPLDEWDQVHANAAAGSNSDEQRVAGLAWFRLDASARPDRRRPPTSRR